MGAVRFQDITFFGDDDVTPLLGTVDAGGNVTVASFSSDPAHVRPYLDHVSETGESEVLFAEGKSVIGMLNFLLLDKRQVTTDQTTGIVTALLAGASGDTQLLMRRAVFRQQLADGSYMVAFDGVLASFDLDDTLVAFRGTIRDIREREQRTRIFTKADTTGIFPTGTLNGYGQFTRYDSLNGTQTFYLIQPIGYLAGTFRFDTGGSAKIGRIDVDQPNTTGSLFSTDAAGVFDKDHTDKVRKLGWPQPVYAADGSFIGNQYAGVIVEWRVAGSGGAWKRLTGMPYIEGTKEDVSNVFISGLANPNNKLDAGVVRYVVMSDTVGGANLPTNGQRVEFRVFNGGPPTEDFPLYIDRPMGDLLSALYNSTDYTDTNPNVRYDATTPSTLTAAGGQARLIVTKTESDMRPWVEENIYKPCACAPSIRAGKVYAISYQMPNASTPLLALTDANVTREGTAWGHATRNAVTRVEFTYRRDYLESTSVLDLRPDTARLRSREVTFVRRAQSSTMFGDKPLKYAPATVRAIGAAATGSALGDVYDEMGAKLAMLRSYQATDRFAQGAQELTIRARRSDAAVEAAREGDWCTVGLSWMPDYLTRKRGINRLVQITRIKNLDAAWKEFSTVDAGPNGQPAAQVTVNTITANADGTVSVTVATLPTNTDGVQAEAEVHFALGTVEPAEANAAWQLLVRTAVTGTFKTPQLPSGATVWIRWRGMKAGRRASVWAVNRPGVLLPVVARVFNAGIQIDAGGVPSAIWLPLPAVQGMRVYYAVHAEGSNPPTLTTFLDVASTGGRVALPVTLRQRQLITVQLVPYPGWTGAAVSGTAGQATTNITRIFESETAVLPVVSEGRVHSGGTATLTLGLTDPQARVTDVAFATRQGEAGAMSGYVTDPTAPYAASVTVPTDESSAIRYRITGYDVDGTLKVLIENEVTFYDAAVSGMQVTQRLVSATATQEVWELDALAPDGTHGNVSVTSVTNTTLAAPEVVGTAYTGPHQFTFNRPAAFTGGASAAVRGAKTGYASDDDEVTIPEQGRDTVPLTVVLRPGNSTTTEQRVYLSVADPVPAGGAYITVLLRLQGIDPVRYIAGGTVLPDGSTLLISSGTELEFGLPRPPYGAMTGRVTFLATATGRVQDSDSADVQTQDAAQATVTVGRVTAGDQGITFDQLAFSQQAVRVEAYVREYATDPGVVASVEPGSLQAGYPAPENPILSATRAIVVPVGLPSSYVVVTFLAYDVNGQVGGGNASAAGVPAGRVTIKVQAAAGAPTRPPDPGALAVAMGAGTDVTLSMTMPATATTAPVPVATLRIFRDGVQIAEVTRTAGNSAVQTYTDPARTAGAIHSYQWYTVGGTGVLSLNGSTVQTITVTAATKIPTPNFNFAGPYGSTQPGNVDLTIVPAAGTPSGTTWLVEHSNMPYGSPAGSYSTINSGGTALRILHSHPQVVGDRTEWIRVTGVLAGYTSSDPVAKSITIPSA
jgi:hypothetical protein